MFCITLDSRTVQNSRKASQVTSHAGETPTGSLKLLDSFWTFIHDAERAMASTTSSIEPVSVRALPV